MKKERNYNEENKKDNKENRGDNKENKGDNEENGGDNMEEEGETIRKRGEMMNRKRKDNTTTTIKQSHLQLCSFHFIHVPRHNPKGGLLPWK